LNDQPLIFLADESCDFAFVRVLRQVGYDVTAIVEFMSGASDVKVLELAFEERRILLTEDKNFQAVRVAFTVFCQQVDYYEGSVVVAALRRLPNCFGRDKPATTGICR